MADLIKNVLNETLNKLGLEKKIKEKMVLDLWSEVIGKKIRAHTQATYVNQGVLFVNVDNSAWAHQLLFMKEEFINKINRLLKAEFIKDIRFRSGQISSTEEDIKKITKDINLKKIDLNSKETKKLEDISNLIADKELKEKFHNLLLIDKKMKKWKENNNWKYCSECSTLIPPERKKCSICQLKEEKSNLKELEKVLIDTPWLNYRLVLNNYPNLLEEEFEMIKNNLTKKLKKKIDELIPQVLKKEIDSQQVKVLIQNYVMLETGISPDNLNNRLIKKVIGNNYMKIYQRS